jgi:pilus assembly protein Flp/PilA
VTLSLAGLEGVQLHPLSLLKESVMLAYIRKTLQFKKDEGASAVEYGLLVAAIAAVIVAVVFVLGGVVKKVFSDTCTSISGGGGKTASASCTK